jgi:hypothetical protein
MSGKYSPIYTPDEVARFERDAAAYGTLSRIAQELGFMLRVPSKDIPGDVIAELQRIHKLACDGLDKTRST